MMTGTTKRWFTDGFKREAVALRETSGRPRTEVAGELGGMPTMLRRWPRKFDAPGSYPGAGGAPVFWLCTTESRPYLPVAPILLTQRVATAPNRIWLADIT